MNNVHSLLKERYSAAADVILAGAAAPFAGLLAHRSVRAYLDAPVPDPVLEAAIAAAQSAATSSNLQCWSVIAVRDPQRRTAFAELAGGQAHVADAPLLLLWVADLSRLRRIGETRGEPSAALDYLETFIVGVVDATLAAQNAAVAFEASGLGVCYIGGMRNHPERVAELAGLPPLGFVVFGMTVGYPDPAALPPIKPRLPRETVLHHETYDSAGEAALIDAYGQRTREAAEAAGRTARDWSRDVARRVAGPDAMSGRDRLREALGALGFELR